MNTKDIRKELIKEKEEELNNAKELSLFLLADQCILRSTAIKILEEGYLDFFFKILNQEEFKTNYNIQFSSINAIADLISLISPSELSLKILNILLPYQLDKEINYFVASSKTVTKLKSNLLVSVLRAINNIQLENHLLWIKTI